MREKLAQRCRRSATKEPDRRTVGMRVNAAHDRLQTKLQQDEFDEFKKRSASEFEKMKNRGNKKI